MVLFSSRSKNDVFLTEEFPMETLSGEFKAVASENFVFENRKPKNISWKFLHSWPIKIAIQETKKDIVQYNSHPTSESVTP